jgi:cation transport ATPase
MFSRTAQEESKAGDSDRAEAFFFAFDIALIVLTAVALAISFSHISIFNFQFFNTDILLAALSFLGLIPVVISAGKSLLAKRVSVDLLASIALAFSLISHEWSSAAFITLMLAFARVFDHITQVRAKKIIESLMKYHVENVRIQIGETVRGGR